VFTSATVLLTWAMDWRWGEPRSAWHPVAWLGQAVAPIGRGLLRLAPRWALCAGLLAWAAVVGGVAALAWALEQALHTLEPWWSWPLLALALKPSLAWRMLVDEVQAVGAALDGGLAAGQAQVARLCSRDVAQLDANGVRETALETLAENFNDSLVAPLFWFAVAGLPGAWAWRAVNTLDAMWGYRGRWEWAGKCAARADDVLGWLPARLAAMLLWRPSVSLWALRREAARTTSPNGGWPMAALALRLGVRLGKPGAYVLNAAAPQPTAEHLHQGVRIAQQAAVLAFGWTVAILLLRELCA
jgi:adenosylcobinamide-phosphate synthase